MRRIRKCVSLPRESKHAFDYCHHPSRSQHLLKLSIFHRQRHLSTLGELVGNDRSEDSTTHCKGIFVSERRQRIQRRYKLTSHDLLGACGGCKLEVTNDLEEEGLHFENTEDSNPSYYRRHEDQSECRALTRISNLIRKRGRSLSMR